MSATSSPGVPEKPDTCPASAAIDFSTPPILVHVGEPPKVYWLNEAMLRKASAFFDKALSKDWQEGQQRTVTLPECDAGTFNVWVNWLCTAKLAVQEEDGKPAAKRFAFWAGCISAYLLGDTLLDLDSKDAVIDAVAQEFQAATEGQLYIMGTTGRRRIYENTLAGSTLRRLLIRRLCSFNNVTSTIKEEEHISLIYELMAELASKGRATLKQLKAEVQACEFHEHPPGAGNCYRNKRT